MSEMYAQETIFGIKILEYAVEPANLCMISPNVGSLWCSWVMVVLGSFGSRHTISVPLAFQGYVSELTQGVGSTCGVKISCSVISFSCVSVFFLASMGTVYPLCCMLGHWDQVWWSLAYCLSCQQNLGTYYWNLWCYGWFYGLVMGEQLLFVLEKGEQLYYGLKRGEQLLL